MPSESPARPPAAPWKRALLSPLRAFAVFHRRDAGQHAAAMAYYALLSFAPFMLLLATFASMLVGGSAEDVRASVEALRPLLPAADERIWRRLDQLVEGRGVFSIASFLLLSWLTTRVTHATRKGIVAVFGGRPEPNHEGPPMPRARWHAGLAAMRAGFQSWGVTLGILVVMGLVFVGVGIFELVLASAPGDVVGAGFLRSAIVRRDVVPFLVTSSVALVVYASLPPRRVQRAHALIGAVVVGVLNFVATRLFALFVTLATRRDVIYGSFVGLVSFTAWFFIASQLLLFGAALVAEFEKGNPAPTPAGPASPSS